MDISSTLGDRRAFDYRDTGAELGLRVHGFAFAPRVLSFTLGLEGGASWYRASQPDTRRFGFSGTVDILPGSDLPLRLYAGTRQFTYPDLHDEDLVRFPGLASRETSYGGSWRLLRGPLGGLTLQVDERKVSYADAEDRSDSHGRRELSWVRRSDTFTSFVKLVQYSDRYTATPSSFSLDMVTAELSERWNIRERTTLDLFGFAVRRDIDVVGGSTSKAEDARLVLVLRDGVARGNVAELRYELQYRGPGDETVVGHLVRADYRWRPTPGLELAPYVLSATTTGDFGAQSVEGGGSVYWNPGRTLAPTVRVGAGVGIVRARDGSRTGDGSYDSWGGVLSWRFHQTSGLGEGLELEISRNQQRFQVPESSSPGTSLPYGVLEAGDLRRARADLTFVRSGANASLRGEWERLEANGALTGNAFVRQTLRTHLQGNLAFASATGTLEEGSFEPRSGGGEREDFRSAGGSLRLTLAEYFQLGGGYQETLRRYPTLPQFRLGLWEASLRSSFRQLSLDVRVYWQRERQEGLPERRDRGLMISLSRGFGGFLPIVTGGQRRGVIR